MKILYHHRIKSRDGQSVHIEELVRALELAGHDVLISGPTLVDSGDFGADAGMVAWLKRNIPQMIYELVEFTYNFRDFWRLFAAALKFKPDCLYERYNLYTISGILVKRWFKLPMLLEVNAPIHAERSKHDGIALNRLAKWTENFVWQRADLVLPVTQVLARIMIADGTAEDNIRVIHNGINPQRFTTRFSDRQAKSRLGLQGKVVLGFVGFMRDWHGLEKIVNLVCDSRQQDLHLLIVGDGPARKSVEDKAHSAGAEDRVSFTGVVGRDDLADYIAAFDIALQPDVVPYASPLKIFEYMHMGCAIVAPATDNTKEILQHEHDALLFEADNFEALREAVERLVLDSDLRLRLGRSAKETISERGFLWSENARRVADLFHDLTIEF